MKIINLGRCQGKTIRLLYASEFNNIPILCASIREKERLIRQAKELNLKIPSPISVNEINGVRGTEIAYKDILIDEAPYVLQCLLNHLGMKGEIKAITLTEKDDSK